MHHESRPSRIQVFFGGLVVLGSFAWLCDARLWRPDTVLTIVENVQIAEAQAWWRGRLDIPERRWDTALYRDRVYSHFPPFFSFIAAAVVPFSRGFPHWCLALFVVLPVPILAYSFFLEQTRSAMWGAITAIGLVCGTSILPVLEKALRGGQPYFVNLALMTSGLLIMLKCTLGRRRPALAGMGLFIAALSRQLTTAYLLPLACLLLASDTHRATTAPSSDGLERSRTGGFLALALTAVGVIGAPMLFNSLKFSGPFDSGYMYLYAERDEDSFSRDAKQYGLFSPHFLPRNLYHANLGLPDLHRVEIAGEPRTYLRPNDWGTGIWWTTPILLWLFVDLGRILRDPARRTWLLSASLVFAALMTYHSTGFQQRGFNRYSLEYVPVLIALIVPECFAGRRKWISLGMIGWSVAYFGWLASGTIRVW